MKFLNLYIDESGQSNPKAKNSGVYILSGCMVDNNSRELLKIHSDQIKFKYWEKTNIVFHSREIGRKEGNFELLKDIKIRKSFENNFFQLLNLGHFQTLFIIVDLKKARKLNWNEDKVYSETAKLMVKNFLLALLAYDKCRGRIVIESATSKKDFYFHKAASYFLSAGLPELKVDYIKVQGVLTEISFVTKKNYDIEEQIADILAYGARLKFFKAKAKNNYERRLLKTVNAKLFRMDPKTGKKKKKFYCEIESFKIVP